VDVGKLEAMADREGRLAWRAFLRPSLACLAATPLALTVYLLGATWARHGSIYIDEVIASVVIGLFYGLSLGLALAPICGVLAVVWRLSGRAFWFPIVAVPTNLLIGWLLLGSWVTSRAASLHSALETAMANPPPLIWPAHVDGALALVLLVLNLPVLLVEGSVSLFTGGWVWQLVMLGWAMTIYLLLGLVPSLVASIVTVGVAIGRGISRRSEVAMPAASAAPQPPVSPAPLAMPPALIHRQVLVVGVYNALVGALGLIAFLVFEIAFWGEASTMEWKPSRHVGDVLLRSVLLGAPFVLGAGAVIDLVAGIGILRKTRWGRTAGIIASLVRLPFVPIGFVVGAYSLFVLCSPRAAPLFVRRDTAGLAEL
jgi:hypothetical protein